MRGSIADKERNKLHAESHIGKTYNKLTIISVISRTTKFSGNTQKYYALCRCECGNTKEILLASVIKNLTKSCGCIPKHKPSIYENGFNRYYDNIKNSAKKRGYEFSLPKNIVYELVLKDCYYCGSKPIISRVGFIHNGLDRIDNTKGYETGNVVPCCYYCNVAKNDSSVEEFLERIRKIYNHNIKEEKSID